MSNAKIHVKKGDTVIVISGKDKNKKGEVLKTFPDKNRVLVKGVNMVTKHVKAKSANQQGGIIHQEGSINSSNVMLYCTKCNTPTRIEHKILEDGSKVRICKHCKETF